MNVSGLVGAIPTTSVTVRTFGSSTVNAYGETTASSTDATRSVVVHPATTAYLDRLPEADRHRETVAIYSTSALTSASSVKPMLVYYQSTWYQLVSHEDYDSLGGIYIAMAQRLEEQPAAP
jgi:hypothetical protein